MSAKEEVDRRLRALRGRLEGLQRVLKEQSIRPENRRVITREIERLEVVLEAVR